jgi:prepilin-type N-terminal cleavage/methylation domain-containing protein
VHQRIRETRRQKESGFTLTELLIVIVILGVLAGIVVFAVQAFQNRGESAACRADFKATQVAVEAYYAQQGAYPDQWSDIVPSYLRSRPRFSGIYVIKAWNNGAVQATGACAEGAAGVAPAVELTP